MEQPILALITVACDLLAAPSDGTRSSDNPDFPVADTLAFECNSGFTLIGSGTLTCKPDGNWNDTVPICGKSQCMKRKTLLLWFKLNFIFGFKNVYL